MRILYLCSLPGFQVANDVSVLESLGHKVFVVSAWMSESGLLETYPEFREMVDVYEATGPLSLEAAIHRRFFPFSKLLTPRLSSVRRRLMHFLTEWEIDLVYSSWDTPAVIESYHLKRSIEKAALSIPVVFRFLMYPASLNCLMVDLENAYLCDKIRSLDGRIWPTETMYEYCRNRNMAPNEGTDIVFPFLPSMRYFPADRMPLHSDTDNEPHLIFIGSSDFSRQERNISSLVRNILESKMHFHMAKISPSTLLWSLADSSEYLHLYDPVRMSDLARYMTAYDGCVIAYNYESGLCLDRIRNGLPNRIFWAIAAGIPIFVFSPNGELVGCEKFVEQSGTGVTVRNVEDIRRIVQDERTMAKLRDAAPQRSMALDNEKNARIIDNYLRGLKE